MPAAINQPNYYSRLSPTPLDITMVFSSLSALTSYAAANGSAYAGQIVSVSSTNIPYIVTFNSPLSVTPLLIDNFGFSTSLSANWNSVYSSFNSQSANNSSVYSYVNANTGNWNSISFLQAASANNASVYSSFNSQSANNASVYSQVNSNSGNWGGSSISSVVSGNWQSTFSTVCANSANWGSISFLQSASANNASVYKQVNSLSGVWGGNTTFISGVTGNTIVYYGNGSTSSFSISSLSAISSNPSGFIVSIDGVLQQPVADYTISNSYINFSDIPFLNDKIVITTNSVIYNTTGSGVISLVTTNSNNWDSAYNTVTVRGPLWDSVYSTFNSQSANNASVYSTFNSQSANNASVYSTFNTSTANTLNVKNLSASGNIYGNTYLNIQNGTTYTIQLTDNGTMIGSTNVTTGLTATVVGSNYPVGFQVGFLQLASSKITLSGQNITINNFGGYNPPRTTGTYSAATLVYTGTPGWVTFGSLSS